MTTYEKLEEAAQRAATRDFSNSTNAFVSHDHVTDLLRMWARVFADGVPAHVSVDLALALHVNTLFLVTSKSKQTALINYGRTMRTLAAIVSVASQSQPFVSSTAPESLASALTDTTVFVFNVLVRTWFINFAFFLPASTALFPASLRAFVPSWLDRSTALTQNMASKFVLVLATVASLNIDRSLNLSNRDSYALAVVLNFIISFSFFSGGGTFHPMTDGALVQFVTEFTTTNVGLAGTLYLTSIYAQPVTNVVRRLLSQSVDVITHLRTSMATSNPQVSQPFTSPADFGAALQNMRDVSSTTVDIFLGVYTDSDTSDDSDFVPDEAQLTASQSAASKDRS